MSRQGFAFMAEAAFACILLAIAASFLPLFSHKSSAPSLELVCNDAAIVLSKSGAFASRQELEMHLQELSSLSGACMEIRSEGGAGGECGNKGERVAVTFPAWQGGVSSATLVCSHD